MKHALLKTFKERMRIFHDAEDDNLSFILQSSQEALDGLLGISLISTRSGKELIIERSRFVYNDNLELFYESYKNEIARIALETYVPEEETSES
ncbi:phage head-tail connector protein [Streptococcus pluranimalium]|uniref:phage head-tail connector protein n=1 Tax=Streptococcus pluranimalium TaxID=82348 RepID=UPI004046CC87